MSNNKGSSPIVSPQSGGAQSGLGETFSPDLFSGTGNFSVPIAVPAGRNGFQPEITLGYSSGNGNGAFGMGWNLSIPGITRKTSKGIPVYNDNTDIFILSGAEDLVPVKKESGSESSPAGLVKWEKIYYRPRTEGLFARIIHHKKSNGEDYWEVRSKDGLISWYGSPKELGDNRAVVANPESRNQIYAWSLTKTEDPFGNEIIYQYNRELVLNTKGRSYDQLYLKNIQYAQYNQGNQKKYLCEVAFVYEERPDAFSTYRQGFEVRTTKRCIRIESFTHAAQTEKVKTYHFDYNKETPLNGATLLGAVSVEGHKGTESEWMPPLDFNYSNLDLSSPPQLDKIEGLSAAYLTAPGFELIDVTGNGLPDLVQMDVTGSRYWTNKGNGKFSAPKNMQMAPGVYLGTPGVQMIDANGDGRADLLVTNGVQAGYYPGKFRQVWDEKSYRPYQQAPSFSFTDPEVQLIDLDGDGITDVLRNGSKFECFLNDPEKGFYTVRTANKQQIELSFSDPRIRFADMTGDGLQDIVMITSGKVQYWPNLGYGRFGNKIVMRNAPRFPQNYDPKMILLGDLDGDGQADIAFVENNSVTLYINQSGNAFSDGYKTYNTPVALPDSVRICDMMGTGQSGILWNLVTGNAALGQLRFLDFTRGNKPYVLQAMNNNMGSLTRVEYGSSVYHYLRDESNPATRWKTDLPFPVQVVNKVEVLDLLSGGKLVTQYNYHHGYWDGFEREFRGFACVDVQDTETFERYNTQDLFSNESTDILTVTTQQYSPPVQTRNWFYPGPVGGASDWIDPDFSEEYWQGDQNVLERPQATKDLLKNLPRRARRDALRTLRGTLLRSEQYALDGSDLQSRPYTITESAMGIRQEFDPAQIASNAWTESQGAYWSGGGYIFFPFSVAQRSSQYERGDDPMHSYSFTQNYDAYGQVQGALSVGLPRKSSPIQGANGEYLGTYELSEYIYVDTPDQYMIDRVKRSVAYDATLPAQPNLNIFLYRDTIFGTITQSQYIDKVIACAVQYYDGAAFSGLPYGKIGKYGAVVRSESLVITDDIITKAYGTTVPECFKNTPDWSSANGYPADFSNLLQNGDARLGYKDRRVGFSQSHIPGWYAEGARMQYDFQDGQTTAPFGLVQETRDVFENRSTIEYDTYQLLPEKARQWLNATDYLETTAEYDYRTFQVDKITDPNDNISVFDYSPLGLLKATAIIGKGTEGDYKSNTGGFYERYAPSAWMEYDFFAFKNTGNPVWVKTTQREQHWQQDPSPNSPTLIKVEYSDGFGRLLQTRTQAEDVIFGDTTFGSSGLNPVQGQPNDPATGTERAPNSPLNVVVSGWQIYNNKGKVVEQYEPFFDKGFDYQLPGTDGVKITMYYDPLQRVVRTVNPDKSEQRVYFGKPQHLNDLSGSLPYDPTPWESVAYDANDLASITGGGNVPTTDYFTPKSSEIDALGRTIRTTEHWDNSDYNDTIVMQYRYDIRGNLLQVKDPYGRTVFEHVYDLANQPLKNIHIDSGISHILTDATGKPIEASDAKGARTLSAFDTLQRPTHVWAQNNSSDSLRLTIYSLYGEAAVNPKTLNLLGQAWQVYDESGKTESVAFDFKGNLLSKRQQVINSTELKAALDNYQTYLVDWTGLPAILSTQIFETSSEYDALNRVTQITLPENVNNERKEIVPTYNRAGALEQVRYDGTVYVENIAYNAKGQRLLIAFGNDIMTRYVYQPTTFRLVRQRSEKFTKTQVGNTITYTAVSGTNRQDDGFNFDLVGNILKTLTRVSDCGITGSSLGSDALDKVFTYNSVYRLTSATGRESNTQHENDYLYADAPVPGSPNANHVQAYKREYDYDKLGNVLQVKQIGNNAFTRNFNYHTGKNTLEKVETASASLIEDFTYDACGNQLTAGASRNYVWNTANQLITYYNQAGTSDPTIFAQYDYAGQERVSKMVRTGTSANPVYERTVYIDGIFEYHLLENGTTYEKNYVHIMDDRSRIAMVRVGDQFPDDINDVITYNLENQIGSSTVRLTETGTIIDKEEYYPFGDSSLRTFSKKRYRYVGREKDLESGLYYYGARYYCAWACRFISVDPLAPKYAQLTPYNYADNNPVNDYDIDGMQDNNTSSSEQGKNDTITIQKTVYLQSAIDEDGNPIFDTSQLANYGNYAIHNMNEVYGNKDVSFNGKQYTTNANFNYKVLLPGENVELGENDVLWTIKNQGDSFVKGNTASMNYNDRGNTAAHEMGHHLGLSDRYHYIQKVKNAIISEDYSTHPMALHPKVDPEYFGNESSNLMSSGGSDLTSMQWDIILSNKTEQEYKQVTFFITYAKNVNPSKKYPALAPIGEHGMSYYKLLGKDKYELKGPFQGIKGYYNPFTKEASNTNVKYLFNHPNSTPTWKKNTANNPERSLIPYTR